MEIDENLLSQVSDFLNTSEGAQIVSELKNTLGIDDNKEGSFASLLGGSTKAQEKSAPSIDVSKLIPLVTAISSAKTDDRATNLLLALKPLLHKNRQVRIDKAISIMKIMALIPILEEYGFSLGDLFS
jgi:hypothetical protein